MTISDALLGGGKPLPIVNMKHVSYPDRLKLVLYGLPGHGKTTLGANAPKPLLFDFEGGVLSIIGKDVDVVNRPSPADFKGYISTLVQQQGAGYETIVIDTVTAGQRQTLLQALGATAMKAGYDEYGYILTYWRRILEALERLPVNVILLMQAHEIIEGDGDHERRIWKPLVTGKLEGDIEEFGDGIGFVKKYIQTDRAGNIQETYQILWKGDGTFMAKDRSGWFGMSTPADLTVLQQIANAKVEEQRNAAPQELTSYAAPAPPPAPATVAPPPVPVAAPRPAPPPPPPVSMPKS